MRINQSQVFKLVSKYNCICLVLDLGLVQRKYIAKRAAWLLLVLLTACDSVPWRPQTTTATATTATNDNGPIISQWRPHGGLRQSQTLIFSRPY